MVALTIAVCPRAAGAAPPPLTGPDRPNFVFILIDDMRWDVLSCAGHPFVKTPQIDRIAADGVRFTNAFVTTSLCSPSRASFLTGCYASRHGVHENAKNDPGPETPMFPQVLHSMGYETGYVGKWHMKIDGNPRPGFDYWLSFERQGEYLDPELNENGREFKREGYLTDTLNEYAAAFIRKPRSRPFCLYLSHKAMHGEFIPAERHKDLYAPSDLVEPESWSHDMAGKPKWLREATLRGGRLKRPVPEGGIPERLEPTAWDPKDVTNERRLNWHRTLAAVDEGVGQVFQALKEAGAADNTYIIFAGDNGFFLGEHRRTDKRLAYEESIRIPLLISGPGVKKPGSTRGEMALNIDVAPTILDLAGAPIPASVQGRSLRPLLQDQEADWRTSFFYEYFREDWLPGIPSMVAVRTPEWKYIHYPDIEDIDELYDLRRDPHEMRNLVDDPAARDRLEKLRAELQRLREKAK